MNIKQGPMMMKMMMMMMKMMMMMMMIFLIMIPSWIVGSILELRSCPQDNLGLIQREEIEKTEVPIMMTVKERILLSRYLQSSHYYFEYGSGGSTLLACQTISLRKILTVESNVLFLQQLINNSSCLQSSYLTGRLQLRLIDIGPIGDFSNPIDSSMRHLWPAYPEAVLHEYEREPDLILIDGRFRVASTLFALLALKVRGKIVIHDFFIRSEYYEVLKYLEMIDCVENLVVLEVKAPELIDWMQLERDLLKYKYVFQ